MKRDFIQEGWDFFLVGVWVVWRQYAWMGKRDRKKMAIDWVLGFFCRGFSCVIFFIGGQFFEGFGLWDLGIVLFWV